MVRELRLCYLRTLEQMASSANSDQVAHYQGRLYILQHLSEGDFGHAALAPLYLSDRPTPSYMTYDGDDDAAR